MILNCPFIVRGFTNGDVPGRPSGWFIVEATALAFSTTLGAKKEDIPDIPLVLLSDRHITIENHHFSSVNLSCYVQGSKHIEHISHS